MWSMSCGPLTGPEISSIFPYPDGYYIDVHTTDYEKGAIRGQLTKG